MENYEDYLKNGGYLRKDCWLNAMHLRYNPTTGKCDLVDSVSTSDGLRIFGIRESFDNLQAIPYVGKWIKCNDKGEPIE